MAASGGPVGPRGGALLAVAALVGALLAAHGWSTRHAGLVAGGLSAGASASGVRPAPTRAPSHPRGSAAPAQGPASGSATPAPLLRSQSFASYSYPVWPGSPDAAARAAMTGLSISVHKVGGGISVTAGVSGQPGVAHVYPGGTRVYVVEASMGDEGGNSDYNLGDDGVVVTDAAGRIVQ